MRTCPHEEVLHAYTEGWLDARSQQAVEAHLAECHQCQSRVAGWQAVSEALRALPVVPAPTGTLQPAQAPHREWRVVLTLSACLAGVALGLWLAGFYQPDFNRVAEWTPFSVLSEGARQAVQKFQPLWSILQEALEWRV